MLLIQLLSIVVVLVISRLIAVLLLTDTTIAGERLLIHRFSTMVVEEIHRSIRIWYRKLRLVGLHRELLTTNHSSMLAMAQAVSCGKQKTSRIVHILYA